MKNLLNSLKWVLPLLFVTLTFTHCTDEGEKDTDVQSPNGVFILNQGSDGDNNASLSFYDFDEKEMTADLLEGSLGDLAQDMIAYGNKLYITVYGSSNITVLNKKTMEVERRILVVDEANQPRGPRQLANSQGKVYASCYDGTVIRIDTTSLAIEAVCPVGPNPEGVAIYDRKLYVANSGGLRPEGPDNTVSVVNLFGFQEEEKIEVAANPCVLAADNHGNIYLTAQGNFFNDAASRGFQRIDSKSLNVTTLGKTPKNWITIADDMLYYYDAEYDENWNVTYTYGTYDIAKRAYGRSFITDKTKIGNPYSIAVNPYTKEIYVSDTDYVNPGKIYIFNSEGRCQRVLDQNTGINPCRFVFNY